MQGQSLREAWSFSKLKISGAKIHPLKRIGNQKPAENGIMTTDLTVTK
jgi:hypothetical protein